jgi:hypothetical protein
MDGNARQRRPSHYDCGPGIALVQLSNVSEVTKADSANPAAPARDNFALWIVHGVKVTTARTTRVVYVGEGARERRDKDYEAIARILRAVNADTATGATDAT